MCTHVRTGVRLAMRLCSVQLAYSFRNVEKLQFIATSYLILERCTRRLRRLSDHVVHILVIDRYLLTFASHTLAIN